MYNLLGKWIPDQWHRFDTEPIPKSLATISRFGNVVQCWLLHMRPSLVFQFNVKNRFNKIVYPNIGLLIWFSVFMHSVTFRVCNEGFAIDTPLRAKLHTYTHAFRTFIDWSWNASMNLSISRVALTKQMITNMSCMIFYYKLLFFLSFFHLLVLFFRSEATVETDDKSTPFGMQCEWKNEARETEEKKKSCQHFY